jgi:hypothetical protein
MLLGARSVKAAAAATATTAAAGAAQVTTSAASPQFDDSKLPQHPLALNKVLSAADIAAARALIAQVRGGAAQIPSLLVVVSLGLCWLTCMCGHVANSCCCM